MDLYLHLNTVVVNRRVIGVGWKLEGGLSFQLRLAVHATFDV